MLAQLIFICYGEKMVAWYDLEAAMDYMKEIEAGGRIEHHPYVGAVLQSDAARMVSRKMSWKDLQFDSKSLALEYLLDTNHDMESTETRDRIYGFLGLVEDLPCKQNNFAITADYSLSREQIFLQVYRCLQVEPKYSQIKTKLGLIDWLRDLLRLTTDNTAVEAATIEVKPPLQYRNFKPLAPRTSSPPPQTYMHNTPRVIDPPDRGFERDLYPSPREESLYSLRPIIQRNARGTGTPSYQYTPRSA